MKSLMRKFIDLTNDEERMDAFFDNLNKATDTFFEIAETAIDTVFDGIHEAKLESDLEKIDEATEASLKESDTYFELLQEKIANGEALDGEDVENIKKKVSEALGGFGGIFEEMKSDLGGDDEEEDS
ncbi:hypothetical protein KAH37_09285 [bacterium]|nr:hypothetical protein [bacterium]